MNKKESAEQRKRLLDAFKELTDIVVKIDEEMESVKHVNRQAQRSLVPCSQYITHYKGKDSKGIEARYVDEKGNVYRISITKEEYKK